MSATSFPLFLSSDSLRLDPAFIVHVAKRRLVDTSLGVFHSCSQEALPLLEMLRQETTLNHLQVRASEQNITAPELSLFLGFLNNCGALRRNRSLGGRCKAWRTTIVNRSYGLRYGPLTWRRSLSVVTLAWGSIRACSALVVLTFVLDLLLVSIGRWGAASILEWSVLSLSIFVCSIVIHEYAHACVIARWGHPMVVIQHGLHIGLLHARLSRSIEIASALAGPFCGCVFSLCCALSLHLTHRYNLAALALCMSALHLAGLSPWYGDGRSLWLALRERNELT